MNPVHRIFRYKNNSNSSYIPEFYTADPGESSWFDSSYAAGATPVCIVLGYRRDAWERGLVLATGVTPVSLRPLITISNLGAWSCLDVV
jgi:hypothetical protein